MLATALTALALVWALVIVATPIAAATGHGTWGAAIAYHIGSLICHQRPVRSFHLMGIQMPVCARCFGLYASGAAGLLLAAASVARGSSVSRNRLRLGAAALPIAVTVALEWAGAIETGNWLRFATGLPLGVVAGLLFGGLLRPAR
ncbi:MAG TPA: DUF2085 domain-containing protein [Vicinamibacterales bacterium]|nr:DUF2085 domain-containing protein [Vicinamibacterales bacterium]